MSEEYNYPEGGERRYEGDGPNLRYDEFVARIVQDPQDPPGVTLLSGYLGASSEEGCVRLYLDEELGRYVEIPEKAIRHTQELSPKQSPLGGSLVWIDRDAEVLHGAAGSERRKATFLEGQIAEDYLGGGGGHGYVSGEGSTLSRACVGPPPTSVGLSCGPSRLRPCVPQTEFPGCRTRTGIYCTKLGPGCGLTSYDPACTLAGQNCYTALAYRCQSINAPCVTQNQPYCAASGFFGCVTIDFTIYEQPGYQQQFGQQFGGGAQAYAKRPTRSGFCDTLTPDCGNDPTLTKSCGVGTGFAAAPQTYNCPSALDACPTRYNCPSQYTPCQSQLARCPSALDACPTRYNCPSQPNGCPGHTRLGACETYGPCPSAVDACPTRLGCYNTAVCGESVACYPGGGGGGFDPGGFGGGGFGGGF
jgi:hypothetical protein